MINLVIIILCVLYGILLVNEIKKSKKDVKFSEEILEYT